MNEKRLQIQMFGSFTIRLDGSEISDSDNRSWKIWLLLAYMIYCRNRPIGQEEMISLLWGEEERGMNPANALKTMFHRLRSMLNKLEGSIGYDLIVRRDGSYAWNLEYPIALDVDEFDHFCRKGASASDGEKQLEYYLKAVQLYKGDFLAKLSSESWVVPIAAYYHNLYLQVVQAALPLLEEYRRQDEAVTLCRRAIEIEPYNEELYQFLMRSLMELGDRKGAAKVYEEMSELLFANFGVTPSEESLAIYRDAVCSINDRALPMGVVREQLREPSPAAGALICDYDFFKVLYHAEARFLARSGDAIHIALLSVEGKNGEELPKRSLNRAMENLRDQVRLGLRKGDVATRCSVSQYLLMLPQANYENSCMVCERIIRAFTRQYPHSPVRLHYSVQPMEPNV